MTRTAAAVSAAASVDGGAPRSTGASPLEQPDKTHRHPYHRHPCHRHPYHKHPCQSASGAVTRERLRRAWIVAVVEKIAVSSEFLLTTRVPSRGVCPPNQLSRTISPSQSTRPIFGHADRWRPPVPPVTSSSKAPNPIERSHGEPL